MPSPPLPDPPASSDQPYSLGRLIPWIWPIYWLFIFIAMHVPNPPGGQLTQRIGDKLVHAAVYFVLAFLGGWSARWRNISTDRLWLIRWWVIYAAYAAVDELLQMIPALGRACELGDFLADVAGATLALIMVSIIAGHRQR